VSSNFLNIVKSFIYGMVVYYFYVYLWQRKLLRDLNKQIVVNSDKITPMNTKMCGAKEVVINR